MAGNASPLTGCNVSCHWDPLRANRQSHGYTNSSDLTQNTASARKQTPDESTTRTRLPVADPGERLARSAINDNQFTETHLAKICFVLACILS